MDKIGVIGAGAWGTALASVARRAGRDVTIWAREPDVVEAINTGHQNTPFLPGVDLDPAIRATGDLAEAADADALILVTPAQFLRPTAESLAPMIGPDVPLVVCAKGIEIATGALMNEVVEQALPERRFAVLSGPTFAAEVARELPTAITLACADVGVGERLTDALGTPRFRIYRSEDVIGAEVGGAVKNVLAIACGIVDGRGLGDNARAAIITRGLAEMARLSAAKGGRAETLMGLSGIGDLTLTCNAMQSRNFSLGVALGQGRGLAEVLGERNSVAEGVDTAAAVTALAATLQIDMPICLAVDGIVNHGADIEASVSGLLKRPVGTDSPLDERR
ncbi:MAG: NAD(P)-dependent glycerol-3-phosphate dehydrogenase [Magnetovibrio sp.]|nr:NAD(P)-dependent glycerol-3-phosphate dehydrogenase [Magnetovibrio sp.]